MIKKILIVLIFFLNFNSFLFAIEKSIRVKYQVNEDLITNYDIIKEAKYLTALNIELKNIDQNQLTEYAKNSLIKEKIKKYEIEKYYEVNYKSTKADTFLNDFMKKLNINSMSDFNTYLSKYETNVEEVRKKIVIEQTWNNMKVENYKDRVI